MLGRTLIGSFCAWLLLGVASLSFGQLSTVNLLVAHSVSGQFVISAPPRNSYLYRRSELTANTNFIRLEPALVAISAERFRDELWDQLGIKPGSSWKGKIYLAAVPARTPTDDVTIASEYMPGLWSYHVTLPDIVERGRYMRALSAVVLLEIVNRNNLSGASSAPIPAWLIDGLARGLVDEDAAKIFLSAPSHVVNDLLQSSVDQKKHGLDSLVSARAVLQDQPALTFEQLDSPTDTQINGFDGGIYLASAQLFVHDLLALPGGPRKLRDFLARLPVCENWQTAFYAAFRDDFQRPLEVEKWWSLRTIHFSEYGSTAQWTVAESSAHLASLLTVPVEVRSSSNSLPSHAQVSWQTVIRDFQPPQREDMLSSSLRVLELAQFRLAPSFAALAAGYRDTLADFLGERKSPVAIVRKNTTGAWHATARDTIRQLNLLDVRRRQLVARLHLQSTPMELHAALP